MALVQHTSLGFARERASVDAKHDPAGRDRGRDKYEDSGSDKKDA